MKKNISTKITLFLVVLCLLVLPFTAAVTAKYIRTMDAETVFTMNINNRYPEITNNLGLNYTISGSPRSGFIVKLTEDPSGFTHVAYNVGEEIKHVEIEDSTFKIDTGVQATVTLNQAQMYAFATVDAGNNMRIYNRVNTIPGDNEAFTPDNMTGVDVYKFRSGTPTGSADPEVSNTWEAVKSKVVSVTVPEDVIVPTATTGWFNEFKVCTTFTFNDNLDTSKVSDMYQMFRHCEVVTTLDLTELDTSGVTKTQGMFSNCYKLTTLTMTGWDTSSFTNMQSMFFGCQSLVSLDLSHYDTKAATNMTTLFKDCTNLKSIKIGENWDVAQTTTNTFVNCTALVIKDGQLGSNTINYSSYADGKANFTVGNYSFSNGATHLAGKVLRTDMTNRVEYSDTDTTISVSLADGGGSWDIHVLTLMGAKTYAFATLDSSNGMHIYNRINTIADSFTPDNMQETTAYKFRTGTPTGSADPEVNDTWETVKGKAISVTVEDEVKPTSTENWFNEFTKCTTFQFHKDNTMLLDTSGVSTMKQMFFDCRAITAMPGLSDIKTDNVTNMHQMFMNCKSVTSLDLSGWNTGKVTTMQNMIRNCSALESVNLTGWNTSKVTTMRAMFHSCTSLEYLDLSGFSTKAIPNAYNMDHIFNNCSKLRAIKIGSGWQTVGSPGDIFTKCTALVIKDGQLGNNTITYTGYADDKSTFTIANCTFADAATEKLAVKVTGYATDKQVEYHEKTVTSVTLSPVTAGVTWNSHVVNLMGAKTYAFATYDTDSKNLAIYNRINTIDTKFTADNMDSALKVCKFRSGTPAGSADPENDGTHWGYESVRTKVTSVTFEDEVKPTTTNSWFIGFDICTNFEFTKDGENMLDTSTVSDMYQMFMQCPAIVNLDLSGFDTSKVTNMKNMFRECSALKTVSMTGWDTANVTNMNSMFYLCPALKELTLSFDTKKVTNMGDMFYGCTGLESLDLSALQTDSLTLMNAMFDGCSSLTSLDISGFDTSKVTNMANLFKGCAALKSMGYDTNSALRLGTNFKVNAVTEFVGMFEGCSGFTTLDFSGFEINGDYEGSNKANMNNMFKDCTNLRVIRIDSSWQEGYTTEGIFDNCTALVIQNGQLGNNTITYDGWDSTTQKETFSFASPTYPPEATHLAVKVRRPRPVDHTEDPYFKDAYQTQFYEDRDMSSFSVEPAVEGGDWESHVLLIAGAQKYAFAAVDQQTDGTMYIFNRLNIIADKFVPDNMPKMWMVYQVLPDYDLVNADKVNGTTKAEPRVPGSANPNLDTWSRARTNGASDEKKAQVKVITVVDPIKPKNTKAWFYGFEDCTTINLHDEKGNFLIDTSESNSAKIMFKDCKSLKSVDLSGFVTNNVTDMLQMFSGCESLTNLDLSMLNTSSVTQMQSLFYGCKNLQTIKFGSSFNTSKVGDMSYMFLRCTSLTSLDLTALNTSNVTAMQSMFSGCTGLTSLNLSSFDTKKVILMNGMFQNCKNLMELDLSSFSNQSLKLHTYKDTTAGTETATYPIAYMFNGCENLKTIKVGDQWGSINEDMKASVDTFKNCNNLIGGSGTTYNAANVSGEYARVDGGTSAPGYFTSATATAAVAQEQAELEESLVNLTAVSNPDELVPGEAFRITLIPDPGYILPETVTVMVGDLENPEGVTYENGVITIPVELITAGSSISVIAEAQQQISLAVDIDGLLLSCDPTVPLPGEILTVRLEGETLPATVKVIIDGSEVGDVFYDKNTGAVMIPGELLTKETRHILISADDVPMTAENDPVEEENKTSPDAVDELYDLQSEETTMDISIDDTESEYTDEVSDTLIEEVLAEE